MPRKSAAAVSVVSPATTATAPRLSPPSSLSTAERLEFIALADENRHLRRTDAPMLAAYCQAITRVTKLAKGKDTGAWTKATTLMLALARSMRLTQQAQADPKTVGRQNRKPDAAALLALMNEMNDEAFAGAMGDEPLTPLSALNARARQGARTDDGNDTED
jgi:hypothetical protein